MYHAIMRRVPRRLAQQRAMSSSATSTPLAMAPELGDFRQSLRRWVDTEIVPFVNDWEEAGRVPRRVFRRAGEIGLLGVGYPEEYGGLGNHPQDLSVMMMVNEELCRAGSGGLVAALSVHNIALPPILALGSNELKALVLPQVLAGEKTASLGITEPGGGSDVANMSTVARFDGRGETTGEYIVNGEKTLITGGVEADYITLAVRTGGKGPSGISLLCVDGDTPGLSRTELQKTGWWCSDTATLSFDDCRVPSERLLGKENDGFLGVMQNFNSERIMLAAQCVYFSELLIKEATDWAQQRQTFGKRLVEHQAIRHRLVDMNTAVLASRALLDSVVERYRVLGGDAVVAEICMLKNLCTDTMSQCADSAVQVLGGAGYVRGHTVERLYREVKVMQIGGGSTEIMKDLAARQMGMLG